MTLNVGVTSKNILWCEEWKTAVPESNQTNRTYLLTTVIVLSSPVQANRTLIQVPDLVKSHVTTLSQGVPKVQLLSEIPHGESQFHNSHWYF